MPGLMRILIVEGQMHIAHLAAKMLRDAGYDVVGIANDAAAALPLAQQSAPDLVLTDIQLRPKRDGIAVAREIMRAGNAAILFAAHGADTAVTARLAATRPTGVLPKPYDSQNLFPAAAITRRSGSPIAQTELPSR